MNSKWQINRVGLLDFWYYDEEEFDFLDGRMLLRGANGSGKSVTMQSFIPLLLDGNMRPERLDPFGSRARKMENYLLEEGRKGRTLLFLQGADRLSMLLVERFERYAKNGLLQVRGGQQGLSNSTGLCLKTINRSVKKLSEQGLITKEGNKILVDQSQYERLKEIISKIVTLE